MKMFYDILPLFLFFIAFKLYGVYVATAVGMVATAIQVLASRLLQGRWEMMQCVTLVIFVLSGSMTLYFHDPIFIKWKPTIVFWIFSLLLFGSQWFTKQPIMQRLAQQMPAQHTIPTIVWHRLTTLWAVFFGALGGVNLYIARTFSTEAWVNFKFYGITGALLGFSVLQAVYLMSAACKTNTSPSPCSNSTQVNGR